MFFNFLRRLYTDQTSKCMRSCAPMFILLLIAQLVERGTVMFDSQKSLGRWFESGSRDIFSIFSDNVLIIF